MTEPDNFDGPADDEAHAGGVPPGRRREIMLGVFAVVMAVVAAILAPVFGRLGGFWVVVPLVALVVISYQRRGTGFGVGVAWGCAVILVLGGGACIALIASLG